MLESVPFWQKLFYVTFAVGYAVFLTELFKLAKSPKKSTFIAFVRYCKERYSIERKRRKELLRTFRHRIMVITLIFCLNTIGVGLLISLGTSGENYNFTEQTVNIGVSSGESNRNAEDSSYQTITEADQYTDDNYSGSSENIVTGTGGGTAFPTAFDTDDSNRRTYTEAASGDAVSYQTLRPDSDGSPSTLVPYPTVAHYLNVDETDAGGDGDTTYAEGVSNSQEDTYGMSDATDVSGADIDVTMFHWSRGESTSTCILQTGLDIGGTNYLGNTATMVSISYANFSYTWTLNPATGAEWTISQVNALGTYILVTDANPDTRTTQVALIITFTPPQTYAVDAQITYSSVSASSQTTGFQVLAQGYRTGDTESIYIQAWNYTSTAWVTKTTITASSDTDYNFNLLGWAANCELSSGNTVLLRIVDSSSDASQTVVYLDLLKVNRVEKGYALDVVFNEPETNEYGNQTLYLKGYTTNEDFNVGIYNWTESAYNTEVIVISALSNTLYTYVIKITYERNGQEIQIQITDTDTSSADTTLDTLYIDVLWVQWIHTNPIASKYGQLPIETEVGEPISWFLNHSDFDNEIPSTGYPKVHIDTTDYTMSANDSYVQYTTGKSYYYTKSDLTVGEHSYYFIIKDANSAEITTSTVYFDVLPSGNSAPTIANEDTIPSTAYNGTSICFLAEYWDSDNDAPEYFRVCVNGTYYDCTGWDAGDVTYTDGKGYFKYLTMYTGIHTYFFETKDATSGVITTETHYLLITDESTPTDYNLILVLAILLGIVVLLFVFALTKPKEKKP